MSEKNVPSLEVGIWAQYGDFFEQVSINKDQIKIKIKIKWYSHIVQDTPATMWIPRTQTLSTGPILLTWLNGNLGNLKAKEQVNVTKCTKMSWSMRCRNLTYVSNIDRWFIKHLLPHMSDKTNLWQCLNIAVLCCNYTCSLPTCFSNIKLSCWCASNVWRLRRALSMSLSEMTTAHATVGLILSQRNGREQVGSVGETKLFLWHQLALVCTRASVHLGRAWTNTPTHGKGTDAFPKCMCASKKRRTDG